MEYLIGNSHDWKEIKPKDFWGEIAPCEHVLQIYESHEVFISTLAGFIGDGINSGDCTIVIATDAHLKGVQDLLVDHGINIESLINEDQYIPLNAEQTLSKFMVNDWPDSVLFLKMVSELFDRANKKNRNVRAFGEMVAVLWSLGMNGATVQLEHLWNLFCAKKEITLFCAYPKSGFTEDAELSLKNICAAHSKIISGSSVAKASLMYRVA